MKEYITIFITGFVVLVLELLGGRIMSPFYGNSIYVWASMIGMTIASLAIGYYLGGRFAKRLPIHVMSLIVVLTILPIFGDDIILQFTSDYGVVVGSLLSATLLFAPSLMVLGMFSPIMIYHLNKHDINAGSISGKIFSIGTIGSFLGVIITGFVFIPNIPIYIILIITVALMVLICLIWNSNNKIFLLINSIILSSLIIIVFSIPPVDGVVFDETSMYGNIKVIDIRDNFYALLIDGSLQSFVEKGDVFDSSVPFESYSQIVIAMKPDMNDVLVLGLGSGAVSHEFEQKGITVTTVEIDPIVKKMANKIFGYKGNVIIDDARHMVQTYNGNFDSIVYDIANGDSFPPHLYTQEAFQSMEDKISDDGVLVVHFDGELDGMKVKSVYKTLNSVFREVFIISLGDDILDAKMFYATNGSIDKEMINNNMVYAFEYQGERDTYSEQINKRIENIEGGIILKDNYNPIDIWQAESSQAWREYTWNNFKDYL